MAKDLLNDEDDDRGADAAGKLSSELKETLDGGKSDQDDLVLEVGGDKKPKDEEDDEEESGSGGAPPEGEHKRKKRERGRLREEHEAMRLENERLREENARAREIAAYNAGRSESSGTQKEDPDKVELEAIFDRVDEIYSADAKKMTPEQRTKLNRELRELEQKKLDIATRRALRENSAHSAGQTELQMIRLQHPDVAADQRAWSYADAYVRLQTSRGRARDMNLINEAMEETRREFRMPGAKARRAEPPKDHERQRFVAEPRGAGSPRGDDGGRRRVDMSDPNLRKMARAMYPKLTEKQALQRWVNEVGPGYLKDAERSKRADD